MNTFIPLTGAVKYLNSALEHLMRMQYFIKTKDKRET